MSRVSTFAIKEPRIVVVIVVTIAAAIVYLIMQAAQNTFNLDIDPLVRILIIGLLATIAGSIVNVKLAKKTKGGGKNGTKISHRWLLLAMFPGMIPGIGMLAVAAVPTLWILDLGAEWSVVRLGIFAWIVSVALKGAFHILFGKSILNFLKSKLPSKLSRPFSWTYIGLLTGVFECGIALAFVLKFDILYQATWVDILAFGIGFGAFEAFVIGFLALGQIGQYILCPEPIGEEDTKEESWRTILGYISLLPVGPVERASAICLHVFNNVLVILAVQQNLYLLFWLSFAFKTLADGIADRMTREKDITNVSNISQMWAAQAIFVVLALVSIIGIILLQRI